MKRFLLTILPLALAACAEEAGNSTYFDTIGPVDAQVAQQREVQLAQANELRARNQAALSNNNPLIVQSNPQSGDPLITRVQTGNDDALTATLSQAISNAENGEPAGVQTTTTQTAGLTQTTALRPSVGNNAPDPSVTLTNEAGITDNSFGRIKRRDSIETDAERLAAAKSKLVVVEPEALPARSKANVAAFALATTHNPGQRQYRRGAGTRGERAAGCGRYRSKDDAQRAFLAAGGPEQDRLRLDPDGDGFVCGWSPAPFRKLNQPANG